VQEWQQLRAAWLAAERGGPQCAIVAGEAGIGKTRLAEELVEWAGRQGIITGAAHCYAAEGALAYAPVSAWLRAGAIRHTLPTLGETALTEVARLLPNSWPSSPVYPRPHP
jgi:predicted ATPase